ncbi:LysR substrate-binding domain-containing protein, partial [Sphingosinicella sp.]|uniref:LysR substrate-binding domain-containing protein n=1 Tax=Sphingosinicella sp. TaxID=1917971 RepID=UPI0040379699
MPARPPSLRAISAFEAAARHQSFAKAALELNLTTSAVSHAIKGLETRLRTRLFDRAGRRVALTPEGQTLAVRVRLSLSLLGDAFDTSPWLRRDRLVVSTLSSIAGRLAPSLGDFRRRFPDIELELRCGAALADLTADEVDVAIRFGPGGWTGLQARHLGDESLFPVASPDYRDGDLPRSIEALHGCTLIRHPESTWRLWLHPLGHNPNDFPSTLTIDDLGVALDVARRGGGVALARSWLVQDDLKAGRLVRLFDDQV